jgi:hypothetical protein
MKEVGMVLQRNGGYSFNAKYLGWSRGEEPRFMNVRGELSEIKTREDLFTQISLAIEGAYYLYFTLLQEIIKAPTRTKAYAIFERGITLELEPQLLMLARAAWEAREKLKIEHIDPILTTCLFRPQRYLTPAGLSFFSGTIEQANRKYANFLNDISSLPDEEKNAKMRELFLS